MTTQSDTAKYNELFNIKKFWNIEDLMYVTGLARQTVYNYSSAGKIPFRKVCGKLYFIPDEIINMIYEGEIHEK